MWITYSKIVQVHRNCPNLTVLHRKYYKKPKFSFTLLSQLCGTNKNDARQILKEEPFFLSKPDSNDMKKCAAILQNAGYSSDYIKKHLTLLSYPPAFLKNCLYLCQEYACYNSQIGPAIIDFSRFMSLRITTLKDRKVIPSSVNVLDSILYYLDIPKSECNIQIDDLENIKQIYWKIYSYYLKRELQIDEDCVKRIKKEDYLVSFRLLRDNLYLLKKSFGFTSAELLEMPFLLRTDPENTISILRSSRGVNLKQVIVSHPRLLTVPSQNIQLVNQFLKENNIDFNVLLNDPDVLRMDINKLMYRLAKLIYSPSLNVFKDHPRLPELLRQSGLASERILILKKLNMDCYDLSLLTCANPTFLRHIIEGIDKNIGDDIALIISEKFSLPLKDVQRELNKNKGLDYVPLLTVKNNLEYLTEIGFSKDDIYRSVQILLYPRHLVENALNDILMNSVVVNDSVEYQVLNKKFFLPLALYYIEKEYRFTESGIWSETGKMSNSAFDGEFIASS